MDLFRPSLGHTVLWWGRLGKILQLAAATFIVIEIIGPSKFAEWGDGTSKTAGGMLSKKALVFFDDDALTSSLVGAWVGSIIFLVLVVYLATKFSQP